MRTKLFTLFGGLLVAGVSAAFWAGAHWEEARLGGEPTDLPLMILLAIVLIGNTLAERMQYFGHFETLLQSRFPTKHLVLHNLGWSADELELRPRSQGFADHGHRLEDEKPEAVIAAFGFDESFAGPAGLPKFRADLEKFIAATTTTASNGRRPPRLVLWTPIAAV